MSLRHDLNDNLEIFFKTVPNFNRLSINRSSISQLMNLSFVSFDDRLKVPKNLFTNSRQTLNEQFKIFMATTSVKSLKIVSRLRFSIGIVGRKDY